MSDDHIRFEGSIPEFYDRHLGPLLFEPYAADLARRVSRARPGRFLEVASGTTKATGEVPLEFSASHAHMVNNTLTSRGLG